jgi:hypothetical protein
VYVRYKYDPFHFLKNLYLAASSKESYLYTYFCRACSDALYKVEPGDKAKLIEVLKSRGMSDADIKKVRRSYFRRRCRYCIPDPQTLVDNLEAIFALFDGLTDPKTGWSFFSSDARSRFDMALKYVRAGFLSDPPGMAMYVAIGQTRDGVVVYRCLRTSSSVEGYHQHLSRCVSACAKSAGTEWLDLLRQKFDFCWTVRSLRRIGWYKGCQHCDIALADRLHSLAASLDVIAYTSDWQCTPVPEDKDSVVRHGVHYASVAMQQRFIKAQAQLPSSSGGGASSSSAQQIPKATEVVELGDFLKQVKCVPTANDVEKLLTDEQLLETASSLMRRATALGLNVPKEAAKTMIERWLFAEKGFQVMKEAGLMGVKAKLQMSGVTLKLHDAVPLAQPTTAPLAGKPRVVLPPALVSASATVMKQGAAAAGGEEEEVVALTGAAAEAAAAVAAKKRKAKEKKKLASMMRKRAASVAAGKTRVSHQTDATQHAGVASPEKKHKKKKAGADDAYSSIV